MRILTMDIGGKSIKYTIFSKGKKEYDVKSVKIKDAKKEEALKIIEDIFKENSKGIDGIAMSSPGAVLASGFINGITAIDGFDNFNLINELKNRLEYNGPIKVINDANAVAYADYSTVEKGTSTVTIAVGTGIGGGIIVNGRLVSGFQGFGGEVGIISTFVENSIELKPMTASGSSGFYNTEKYYESLSGKLLEGKEIFKLYDNEDDNAIKAIERMYKGLAIIIFNIAMTINPENFFIAGGLSLREKAPKEIMKYVKELHENINLKINTVNLQNTSFGWEGQLWGAYQFFIDGVK